ncbi:MAG: hypothetical protein KC800_25790 [Candidatus Eremiobacteraeota bacterium]|nr:hypothetical protein [Candidatus Eremiobacteraeota bacterium]
MQGINRHAGFLNPANYDKNQMQVAADTYQPTIDSAKARGCELLDSAIDYVTIGDESRMEAREKALKGWRAKTF